MIKKMKDFLEKWFGKKNEPMTSECLLATTISDATDGRKEKSTMLQRLEHFLFGHYDFRFNVLTEQTEYSPKGEMLFTQVDQRMLNTFCMEARNSGINCWDKDVSRLLLSQKIDDFHPFRHYMQHLPEWDRVDRVSELARRISDMPLWVNGFHRWMLGMAAQWMGMEGQCANAVAPLLVSREQGRITGCR